MAGFWKIGAMAWCLTVLSWLLVPVITFVVNKLFAYLDVDVEQKLKELKVLGVPTAKKMLMAVQKQRILLGARNMGSVSDLQILDEMARDLRSVLYDADDALDLVGYHQIEKKFVRHRSIWELTVGACIAYCKEWFGLSLLAAVRSRCRQGLDHFHQLWWGFFVPRGTPEEQHPSPDLQAQGNPQEEQTSPDQQARRLPDRSEASLNSFASVWQQHLRESVGACIANCNWWFARSLAAVRSRCVQGLDHSDQQQLPVWRSVPPYRTPEEEQPRPDPEAPRNPQEQQRVPDQQACQLPVGSEASLNSVLQRLHSRFLAIYNCCRSILSWLPGVIEFLRRHRDWSYEVVGIKHNKMDGIGLDSFQLMIHGKSLRKIMKDIDRVITVAKESPLLNEQRSSTELSVNDTDKESSSSSFVQDKDEESRSKQKEIDDMHRNIAQPVFGREKDQSELSDLLRSGPSSVIVIHGIAGSGKTTLARCVCDYEKETDSKYFDPIMFIQVSKTFRLHDIFVDAIMEIVGQDVQSSIKDLKSLDSQGEKLKDKLKGKSVKALCAELKEKLKGKRFLLVLDDLWVIGDKNEEEERDILLDVLTAGDGGSRILVTARNGDAAAGLGACEKLPIRELEQREYLSLFMHYALQGSVDDDRRSNLERIGSRIAEKLHRLPLAAVTVAKRLRGKNIDTWETTANLDVLNETMGALWWSYEQLSPDIRRCFEYCSTFPMGHMFDRHFLIRMWIAQGFVNTRNATEDLEDVGRRYFDELLTFSFFSTTPSKGFTIHDLLHKFLETISGSDFFRIAVNGFDSRHGIPREVRHLFIETYDTWETAMTEQILELENLRTLIILEKYRLDEYTSFDDVQSQDLVEEKHFQDIFKKMRKLRVLHISMKYRQNRVVSISEFFGQMKHLRLFRFYSYFNICGAEQISKVRPWARKMKLIFPSSVTQLYQMQVLECIGGLNVSFPEDLASNLIHLQRFRIPCGNFPNISRLTSLQSLQFFRVREEGGHEFKQLKHLNKLRGYLRIDGLQNVRSKEEALEANLAGKTRITELVLNFNGSNPDVAKDVLEGLLPPKNLEKLFVWNYSGSWCPTWMLSRQNHPDAPKNLDRLFLHKCSRLGLIPEGSEFFAGLRWLKLSSCTTWSALPEHMERLTSLKKLDIFDCDEIELLPTTLPQSLENIRIAGEKSKLWRSLQDETHVNRQRIEHVSCKEFYPLITGYGVQITQLRYMMRN